MGERKLSTIMIISKPTGVFFSEIAKVTETSKCKPLFANSGLIIQKNYFPYNTYKILYLYLYKCHCIQYFQTEALAKIKTSV